MLGFNELVFFGHLVAAGLFLLAAGRLGRTWIIALIVVCTVLMNIAVTKQMTLFGLCVTGGNVLFATVFLASDVLNEHFGRREARKAVLIGFAAGLIVLVMMQFVLGYRPNEYDDAQDHLHYFFNVGAYPRIVIFSMISYLLAQLLDVRLYALIRRITGPDRLLWLRSNASTWLSQAFDTVFFTTLALTSIRMDLPLPAWMLDQLQSGILNSWTEWRDAVIFAYLIKILVAAADTPFLYLTTWQPLRPRDSLRDTSGK